MSSSYIVDPEKSNTKKDDSLIIVVNDNGTISVDQETLQSLIMNQANANVSVVRVGQGDCNSTDGDLTFTVDPPTFQPTDQISTTTISTTTTSISTSDTGLVDPFMEMDPEQLKRLETALQSEQAKQILGENVTAMLDMLTVEEQQSSMRYNIELDHCYTSRTCPSDPEPLDPLPIANSPDIDRMELIETVPAQQPQQIIHQLSEDKIIQTPKLTVKKTVGRPRKLSGPGVLPFITSKSPTAVTRPGLIQQDTKLSPRTKEENSDTDPLSSSESSESEPSDNDSDFGPRGPRRGGVRARGGRKGLTTRGGSMAARRGRPNKLMDLDQVQRLNIEMAAAVDAMKTPGRPDNSPDNLNRPRKGIKTMGGKKKEDITSPETIQNPVPALAPISPEKPLQTTNQVKASLISANMNKGDMILTKPGQSRNNQKVYFVQKKISMKPNEFKTIGIKKSPIVITKGGVKLTNQFQMKLGQSEDGKIISIPSKPVVAIQIPQLPQLDEQISSPIISEINQPSLIKQVSKPAIFSPVKIKSISEVKKDRKKSESEISMKIEDQGKSIVVEQKTPEAKKHVKKDIRKSPGILVDALGPALFSTPDIIRRVGSVGEAKAPEVPESSLTPTPMDTSISDNISMSLSFDESMIKTDFTNLDNVLTPQTTNFLPETPSNIIEPIHDHPGELMETDDHMTESKEPIEDDLQSALDPASNTSTDKEVLQSSLDSVDEKNIISNQRGIEGEEHLLATLEMEATKHEEELLAEALLLQEQLDVDLTDPSALDESTSAMTDSILSSSEFDAAMLPQSETAPALIETLEPESSVVDTSLLSLTNDPNKKKDLKDSKEPIQIVRGGRIITLPPIEAPATRSKRLQAKSVSPKAAKTYEVYQREEKSPKQQITQVQIKETSMAEMDSEMEDDEGDNSDSEDDPNRLWCICKRPHNNRFMICCDVCEDWFHGKCVNVPKAMGQQMEEQGIDWICPNCKSKKKADESTSSSSSLTTPLKTKKPPSGKINKKQEIILSTPKTPEPTQTQKVTETILQSTEKVVQPIIEGQVNPLQTGQDVTQCVVCKKEARNSSIYCSNACILMHAQETSTKDKPTTVPSPVQKQPVKITDTIKVNPDARVIVFERKTGHVLTGNDAPTASTLKTWLKEHPTFEVVRPNNLNTVQIGGKTMTTIQTQPGKIGKSSQQNIGHAKMVFTKVSGSKQTILAPSHNKITIQNPNTNKIVKHVVVGPNKSPANLKQTTIKIVPIAPKSPAVPPKQTPTKKVEQKPSTSVIKIKSPASRKGEMEPIRINVRKTLAELLTTRIKETDDLKLTDENIADLGMKIELEMYKYFRDTGAKYKAKYRSLVFNIKDTKNLTLFRKIADRSLTPDAVVRLSPDEMASQELAEWREKETKHQLEMIKKNELDLMAQAKSIVVKTHKGEQIIENDGVIGAVDPKTPVQDIVSVLNNADKSTSEILDEKDEMMSTSLLLDDSKKSIKKKKEREKEKEKEGHKSREKEHKDSKRDRSSSRSQKHRNNDHSRDRRRSKDGKRDKEKDRDRDKDKSNKDKSKEKIKDKKDKDRSRRSSKSRSKSSKNNHKDHKEKDKKRPESEDEKNKKDIEKKDDSCLNLGEKSIEDRLWRHVEDETTTNTIDGNDSDISDREPSSTVNIKTPDINEEQEKEKEITTEVEQVQNRGNELNQQKGNSQTVWRGFVSMVDVAKFFITAQEISGHSKDLMEDLPDTVDVVGRISPDTVWDYITKMKRTGSKEILIIKLIAANDEEKIPYITLHSYLNSRSRFGVVGSVSKNIKDFYIMPFSNKSQIPTVLMPLIGPGFDDNMPHLLLGIILRNKQKRSFLSAGLSSFPAKIAKKDIESRSYTPPPPVLSSKDKLTTSEKIPHIDDKLSIVTQLSSNSHKKTIAGLSRNIVDSAKITKIVPELSAKLDLTSSPGKNLDNDDDDEPYSPGGIDNDDNDSLIKFSTTTTYTATAKNPLELQRKMDELNRQIAEEKQQIQSIQSSSNLTDLGPTLPGLGLDPIPGYNDLDEAYSPTDTRSFTPPPPQGITKFTQPILDKVSDITIPPNLQEILANVKRQEITKVDPYLPSKPGASFLTSLNTSLLNPKSEKTYTPTSVSSLTKESTSTSTLRSLSDMDLIKKAEEELAAVAAAEAAEIIPHSLEMHLPSMPFDIPQDTFGVDKNMAYTNLMDSSEDRTSEEPRPPGVDDDEDLNNFSTSNINKNKYSPKSGVVLNIKRKINDDRSPAIPPKAPRTKSRWGQGPSD